MEFDIFWRAEVCARFPKLTVGLGLIKGVNIEKENEQIKKLKETVYNEVRSKYNVETLKDNPIVRAYRDFYWKLAIDPTKTRPSGEALLRRVLHGNELPKISTVVDAYNLASMKTIIPISGFDCEKLDPPFHVRFANNGETFLGIGMSKPMTLTDKMLVLADKSQVLSVYPHRDSDHTRITESTKNVLIVAYGAPEITERQLKEAVETTLSYIKQVSSGEIQAIKVFSATSK
ncbi:MAG: phenylalanine--tRNA ligase beta subunit-related protein [Candidatus Bathyarchaeia archaeon]